MFNISSCWNFLGIGSGAFIAGFLLKFFSWNLTFIIPGLASIFVGFVLLLLIFFNKISFKNNKSEFLHEPNSKNNLIIISVIMLCSMFGLGLVFQIMQTSLPKFFDIRLNNYSTFKIGSTIGIISGFMNFFGGILADKYSIKIIYILGLLGQIPCYFAIAYLSGFPLIFLCLAAAMFNSSILPAENILLSKFTPEKHHGLIYGCKFIISFGSGPLAVFLVAYFYKSTLEFTNLFLMSSLIMFLIFVFVLFLPFNNNVKISN